MWTATEPVGEWRVNLDGGPRPPRRSSVPSPRAPLAVSLPVHAAALGAMVVVVTGRREPPAAPDQAYVALAWQAERAPPTPAEASAPSAPDVMPDRSAETAMATVTEPAAPPKPVPQVHPEARPVAAAAPQPVAAPAPRLAQATRRRPAPPRVAPRAAVQRQVEPPKQQVAGMEINRAPAYPEMARQRGEQGRVMLRVDVSAEGVPLTVNVLATSGHPMLDSAAQSAVEQWRFVPATQAGRPVAAVADVPVRFQLED